MVQKELQRIGAAQRLGETKPITEGRAGVGKGRRRDQSCETKPVSAAPRGTGIVPVSLNHGRDAHATVPEAQGQWRETKPICATPRSTGILPVNFNHGRDAHATVPEAQGQWRETNPICATPRSTGILPVNFNHGRDAHATVLDAAGQWCETKPICATPRSTGILPVNFNHGRDAHATVPDAEGQSCETKPIRRKRQEGQVPCGKGVTTNGTCLWARRNKANSRRRRVGQGRGNEVVGRCTNKANSPKPDRNGRGAARSPLSAPPSPSV
jgi:hypothetical protein